MTDPEVGPEEFSGILDLVRTFIRDRVVPREDEIAETDAIPADLRDQAKETGLFGYTVPQEWAGSD